MMKIIVGSLIIGIALWRYHYGPVYMYELTFLSNFSYGLALLLDGVVSLIKRRPLPVILYQLVSPCTNSVFITTVFAPLLGWHDFNINLIAFLCRLLACLCIC